jgi:hypothetical protein
MTFGGKLLDAYQWHSLSTAARDPFELTVEPGGNLVA